MSSSELGSDSLEIDPNYDPTTSFIVWLLFTIAFFIVLVPWVINWILHRRSTGIPLHRFFAVTLFLQFAVSLILCSFYGLMYHRKKMGNLHITNTDFTNWETTVTVLSVLAEGVFDGLIILISKGWCITQSSLSLGYKFGVALYVVVYVILTVINNIYYQPAYLLFLISVILLGMYIALILYVFNAVNYNVRSLLLRIYPETVHVPLQVQPYNPNPNPYPPTTGYVYPSNQGTPFNPPQAPPNPYTANPEVYPPSNPYTNQEQNQEQNQNSNQDSPNITSLSPLNQENPSNSAPIATFSIPPTEPPMAYSPSQNNPFSTEMQSPVGHVAETVATSKMKLSLFRIYHKFLVIYIIASLLFSFLPAFFFTWLAVLSYLKYLLVLLFLSGLCWVFRLRPVNRAQYYLLGDEDEPANL